MNRPDLHIHSNASDGMCRPMDLVRMAAGRQVTHMAITDHDTMAGVDRLAGETLPVKLIPGAELSMADANSLHLLAYGDPPGNTLRETLRTLAQHRLTRAAEMLDRLKDMGMPLDPEKLDNSGVVGRPHIARAMVSAGYVSGLNEAFDRFLCPGRPAYVPARRLSMEEALPMLRKQGFVPVLAHPCELKLPDEHLLPLLQKWKEMGLMGMEVYHPSARSKGYAILDRMARRMNLLVTGGSDYHQEHDKHGAIGCMAGEWANADSDLSALLEEIGTSFSRPR